MSPSTAARRPAASCAPRLPGVERLLCPFPLGTQFRIGDCRVVSIPTSHDSRGSTGYRIDSAGCSFGLLTDTGVLPAAAQSLLGVDLLVLESNHDVETLRSGPYPYALKQRVLGDLGHLSNDLAARFAAAAARAGTGEIVLAHLSRENNTPQMALNTVGRALEAAGWQGRLSVAPRDICSRVLYSGGASMQRVLVICVGKLKERFYIDAAAEYVKRLGRFCRLDVLELPEVRLPEAPSPAQVEQALSREAAAIREKIPAPAAVAALCVEGQMLSSEELASLWRSRATRESAWRSSSAGPTASIPLSRPRPMCACPCPP